MSASDIPVPNILGDNYAYVKLWEIFSGTLSIFPSHFDGDNILEFMCAIDHQIQNLKRMKDYMVVSRHVSTENSFSLNGTELNDRMLMNGTPFVASDKSVAKKRRLKEWLKYDLGGGSEGSIKATFYTFIGRDTFLGTDGGNTEPRLTSRINIAFPNSVADPWSSDVGAPPPDVNEILWAEDGLTDEEVLTAGGGFWVDENTLSNADIDLQIFFEYSGSFEDERDMSFWETDVNMARLARLMKKVMPLAINFTITLFHSP